MKLEQPLTRSSEYNRHLEVLDGEYTLTHLSTKVVNNKINSKKKKKKKGYGRIISSAEQQKFQQSSFPH